MSNLTYLQGYPEQLLSQVRTLINEQRLGDVLAKRYPGTHDYATDKALWQYTQDLKNQFLRNAPPINKVMYDNKIHVLKNALGSDTVSAAGRQAESKSRDPRRYRVSQRAGTVLRTIVVHELAHLKEKEHNKAFYQLCCHMPQYHQLEVPHPAVANAVVAWAGQNLKMMSGVIFSFFSA